MEGLMAQRYNGMTPKIVLDLVSRQQGATMAELLDMTGKQKQHVYNVIARLRNKYKIISTKEGREIVYKLT